VHAEVVLDWQWVGDPGNTGNTVGSYTYGAVDSYYAVSRYEITRSQYAAFLNANAVTDTYGLYYDQFGTTTPGITRAGSSGSYTYTVVGGHEDLPVTYVSFYDAIRFANWLHNSQAADSTETGAYTITGGGPDSGTIGNAGYHNAGALYWVPTEDEWYKAAYYDPEKGGPGNPDYWRYATQNDTAPANGSPPGGSNSANYNSNPNSVTDVGAYSAAISHYGTFDQNGNVGEWTENKWAAGERVLRGGGWMNVASWLDADADFSRGYDQNDHFSDAGFRLAHSPEPGSILLFLLSLPVLAGLRKRRQC
jgi:formylglycine-generating enzyme required for sulfatase activity